MKTKKTPMYILAALMWFGFHCGAGFASGAQVKLYAAQYGKIGVVVPIIAWVANCLFMYIGLESCKKLPGCGGIHLLGQSAGR